MGRTPKFTEDDFLDAALELAAGDGPHSVTVAAVAAAAGAPSGSVYHRFASRDLLLARLWLRTVRRFQAGFLSALEDGDVDNAARECALHTVRWAREHWDEARVLLLYRREDLARNWPDRLGPELAELNTEVAAAVRDHARRRYGRTGSRAVGQVAFALVDIPYAAVRHWLSAGKPPPSWIDELVTASAAGALAVRPNED